MEVSVSNVPTCINDVPEYFVLEKIYSKSKLMIRNRTKEHVIQTHEVSGFCKQLICFPPKHFPKSEK